MSKYQMIRMQGKDQLNTADTLSFDGETYTADKDLVFEVPAQAEEHLLAHGFERAKPKQKPAAK